MEPEPEPVAGAGIAGTGARAGSRNQSRSRSRLDRLHNTASLFFYFYTGAGEENPELLKKGLALQHCLRVQSKSI